MSDKRSALDALSVAEKAAVLDELLDLETELASWTDSHGEEQAARDLLAFAADGNAATRTAAITILSRLGRAAEPPGARRWIASNSAAMPSRSSPGWPVSIRKAPICPPNSNPGERTSHG